MVKPAVLKMPENDWPKQESLIAWQRKLVTFALLVYLLCRERNSFFAIPRQVAVTDGLWFLTCFFLKLPGQKRLG